MPTANESDDVVEHSPEATATAVTAPTMERIAAVAVLAFGVLMLIGARAIEVRNETGGIDPRWWPTVIAAGSIACGLWMLLNALRGVNIGRQVEPSGRSGWIQMMTTVVGISVLLALWYFEVSFLILAPLFLIVLNWIFGLRKWTSLLLFPAIIGVLVYGVFQLILGVPL